jgi:hypothetical protein
MTLQLAEKRSLEQQNMIENCHPERISDPAKRETKESKDHGDVSSTMLSGTFSRCSLGLNVCYRKAARFGKGLYQGTSFTRAEKEKNKFGF